MLAEASELGPVAGVEKVAPAVRAPAIRPDHLLTLVDDVGIIQHANGIVANRSTGYCVDDVARGLVVTTREPDPVEATTALAATYQGFLASARGVDGGFRNRLGADLSPRPESPRTAVTLRPGARNLRESAVPNVKNASWSVRARVHVPDTGAEGVLVAQGGGFGGYGGGAGGGYGNHRGGGGGAAAGAGWGSNYN